MLVHLARGKGPRRREIQSGQALGDGVVPVEVFTSSIPPRDEVHDLHAAARHRLDPKRKVTIGHEIASSPIQTPRTQEGVKLA